MTRAALFLLLAVAAGGTFLAINWLLGDEGSARQNQRDEGLRGEPDRIPDLPDDPTEKRAIPGKPPTGSTLFGTVTDTAGAPIEGASVRFGESGTTTGKRGAFELKDVAVTGPVEVRARGFFPETRERGGAERLDFQLTRAAVLFGTVTDESAQPVAKAQVYLILADREMLEPSAGGPIVETDEKGEYVFPGVEAGVFDVGVKAAGYLPQLRHDFSITELQEHRADFVLRRGRTVRVEVAGLPNDQWQAGVWISDSRLRGRHIPPGGLQVLAAALPGRALVELPVIERVFNPPAIVVHGVPEGPADFEAFPATFRSGESDKPAPLFVAEPGIGKLLDNIDAEVKLRLLPAGIVAPVTRDALTNALLFPKVTRFADDKGPMAVDVQVDDKLFLVPTDPRRHRLRFELEGYETKDVELPVERARIHEMEVLLQPQAGTETGSVKLVFEPKLEGRLGVMGRGEAGARQFVAKHGPKGDWIVDKIPVGTWELTLLPTGMIPVKLPGVTIVAGAEQELRVTLSPGAGMQLKVVDRDGNLLDKVSLDLRDPNNERIDIHFVTMVSGERGFTSVNYIPSAATAKADSGLVPGTYTLYAGREGYEVGKSEFSVAGTDVAEVTVTLEKKPR